MSKNTVGTAIDCGAVTHEVISGSESASDAFTSKGSPRGIVFFFAVRPGRLFGNEALAARLAVRLAVEPAIHRPCAQKAPAQSFVFTSN